MTRPALKLNSLVVSILASVLVLAVGPAALASPVGECQAATANQIETGQCLQDTLGAVEQVMAGALVRGQRTADSIDQVTGRESARRALDQSQSVWLQFRELNCAVPGAFAAGGSGSGHFIVSCQIDMTRARTLELDALATGA